MNECKPHKKPGKKKRYSNRISPAKMKRLNAEVLERDDYRCQNPHCEHGYPLDIPHHVAFKSRGGLDQSINLILLCVHCHRLVHDELLRVTGEYPNVYFHKPEFSKVF